MKKFVINQMIDVANEINEIYTILSDTKDKKRVIITELKKPIILNLFQKLYNSI
jgi:hypothetical protein